jgi:hypothetical protein
VKGKRWNVNVIRHSIGAQGPVTPGTAAFFKIFCKIDIFRFITGTYLFLTTKF